MTYIQGLRLETNYTQVLTAKESCVITVLEYSPRKPQVKKHPIIQEPQLECSIFFSVIITARTSPKLQTSKYTVMEYSSRKSQIKEHLIILKWLLGSLVYFCVIISAKITPKLQISKYSQSKQSNNVLNQSCFFFVIQIELVLLHFLFLRQPVFELQSQHIRVQRIVTQGKILQIYYCTIFC